MTGFDGHLRLRSTAQAGGRTTLGEQSFRAPYHLSKPYWDADAETLLVQVVNPTAGILAGDRLVSEIHAAANTALLVTTPSATRVFTMRDGVAECRQRFSVDENGWLEVSPEALVPHRDARFRQVSVIDVAAGGSVYFVDQLLPGRVGFGESWAWSELCLDLTVRVAGELVLRERFAPSGRELSALAEFAGSGITACFANAVVIAPAVADETGWRNELHALHGNGDWIGVSRLCRDGWTIKMIAPNPLRLRDLARAVRTILGRRLIRLRCDPRRL
jgi:urease accessory protein